MKILDGIDKDKFCLEPGLWRQLAHTSIRSGAPLAIAISPYGLLQLNKFVNWSFDLSNKPWSLDVENWENRFATWLRIGHNHVFNHNFCRYCCWLIIDRERAIVLHPRCQNPSAVFSKLQKNRRKICTSLAFLTKGVWFFEKWLIVSTKIVRDQPVRRHQLLSFLLLYLFVQWSFPGLGDNRK